MNKQKLWQNHGSVNSLVEEFTSGDDLLMDTHLVAHDIYGSLAHAQMLAKAKLLTTQEWKQIKEALLMLLEQHQAGQFSLSAGDEDIHTRIENDITDQYPEAGANLHIGRSRNDQILLDMRLFTKEQLLAIAEQLLSLAEKLVLKAKEFADVPMPGYTHTQPAMLSSVGLWLGQFAESLKDDLLLIQQAFELNDQSPLGSGAAYGVSLAIDRQLTAKLLGFAGVQNNSLYCQNSRGKFESFTVHALTQIMHTLGRLASDLVLFTSSEFQFFDLPDELTTGSSIMPQKRNFDLMELLRAKEKTMMSYEFQIASIICGLPSGYNRDLQELKRPYISAFTLAQQSLAIAELVVDNLQVNEKEIAKHLYPEMFAAHWAYQIMKKEKLPFRTAYFKVKENIAAIPSFNAKEVLNETKSQGAPGNLQLDTLLSTFKNGKESWLVAKNTFNQALIALTQ